MKISRTHVILRTLLFHRTRVCFHKRRLLGMRHYSSASHQSGTDDPNDRKQKPEVAAPVQRNWGIFSFFRRSDPQSSRLETNENSKLKVDEEQESQDQKAGDEALEGEVDETESALFCSAGYLELCKENGIFEQQVTRRSAFVLLKSISSKLKPRDNIYDSVSSDKRTVLDEMFSLLKDIIHGGNEAYDTTTKVSSEVLNDVEILEVAKHLSTFTNVPEGIRTCLYDNLTTRIKSNLYSVNQVLDVIQTVAHALHEENTDILHTLCEHITNTDRNLSRDQLAVVIEFFPGSMLIAFVPDVVKVLAEMKFHEVFKFTKEVGKEANSLEENWLKLYEDSLLKHEVDVRGIEDILEDFVKNGYVSSSCIRVVEKLFYEMCRRPNECLSLQPHKLSCAMSYFTFAEHFSEHVLALSCMHFVKNANKYTPKQVAGIVKAVGTVNYQPAHEIQKQFFQHVSDFSFLFLRCC